MAEGAVGAGHKGADRALAVNSGHHAGTGAVTEDDRGGAVVFVDHAAQLGAVGFTPEQLRDTIGRMISDKSPGESEATGPRTASECVLDTSVLGDLYVLGGGDRAFIAELVQLFFEQAPRQLEVARASLDVGDLKAIAKAAHTMKSGSGYLGARRLAELCSQLERRAHAGEGAELTRAIEELSAEYDAVRRALLAHLEQN